jgi:dTDP-L-rhamnose 4-epimerase
LITDASERDLLAIQMTILVVGGAGFIGSHLVDALIESGYRVRIFDNLEPQVHGLNPEKPNYVNPEAEFVQGDIRDINQLEKATVDVDVIFHEASAVGSGQSLFEISKYVAVNSLGTANLLQILINKKIKIQKLIIASSMSVYGEGKYLCSRCGVVYPPLRSTHQMKLALWEMKCPNCATDVAPLPIDEEKPLAPTTIYGITKRDQEDQTMTVAKAFDIPAICLRYFTVYGPRQSLSNPYAGIFAIFVSRILDGESPPIFEDGLETRDFIHVKDVVKANILALESNINYGIFNVGTGRPTTILSLANMLIKKLDSKVNPVLSGKFRPGEVRHGFADNSKITNKLAFQPIVKIEDGINDQINWLSSLSSSKIRHELDLFKRLRENAIRSGLTL